MARFEVSLTRRAVRDLDAISRYIAEQGAPRTAIAYVDRIEARCRSLADFPLVGRALGSAADSLRVLPFESAVIVYRVKGRELRIIAIFSHRQDYMRQLRLL